MLGFDFPPRTAIGYLFIATDGKPEWKHSGKTIVGTRVYLLASQNNFRLCFLSRLDGIS